MEERTDILLSRYFGGEATESELSALNDWLAQSDEHETYFNQLTRLYQQSALQTDIPDVDTEKALEKFRQHITASQLPKRTSLLRLHIRKYAAVAASFALFAGISALIILLIPNTNVEIADSHEQSRYTLDNGVEIILSENSRVEYDKSNPYELELFGEAKFIVETEQKIVVKAGDTFIRDIGTVFTVTAYVPADSVQVMVEQGEVLFYTPTNKGVRLKKNEQAVFKVPADEFLVQEEAKQDDIVFRNANLHEIAEYLQALYGIPIVIQTTEQNDVIKLNADFSSSDSLDDILTVIAETLSLTVVYDERGKYIFGD